MDTFHYTDRRGYNVIRSQPDWRFKARKPRTAQRPKGAYFTDLAPTAGNLSRLCARLRIPRSKIEYVFWFTGREGLIRLYGGRGRDRHIHFSPADYVVARESGRQRKADRTEVVKDDFE